VKADRCRTSFYRSYVNIIGVAAWKRGRICEVKCLIPHVSPPYAFDYIPVAIRLQNGGDAMVLGQPQKHLLSSNSGFFVEEDHNTTDNGEIDA